jgi:hypothetical protein
MKINNEINMTEKRCCLELWHILTKKFCFYILRVKTGNFPISDKNKHLNLKESTSHNIRGAALLGNIQSSSLYAYISVAAASRLGWRGNVFREPIPSNRWLL